MRGSVWLCWQVGATNQRQIGRGYEIVREQVSVCNQGQVPGTSVTHNRATGSKMKGQRNPREKRLEGEGGTSQSRKACTGKALFDRVGKVIHECHFSRPGRFVPWLGSEGSRGRAAHL